jgi:hypothetical protein
MNIREFYCQKAEVSLNGSLLTLVPILLIVIGSIFIFEKLPIILLVLPFGVYSIISFQAYLVQKQYSLEAESIMRNPMSNLYSTNNILLGFMPAPSLRMVMFDPDGNQVGEVRDKRFWWWRWCLPYLVDRVFPNELFLYDQNKQVLAVYKIKSKQRGIDIYLANGKKIGSFLPDSLKSKFKLKGSLYSISNENTIFVEGSKTYPEIKIRNEHEVIVGKLIKGWMPLKWGKQFRDANTPYIMLDLHLKEDDKILIFGVIAAYFQYTSH